MTKTKRFLSALLTLVFLTASSAPVHAVPYGDVASVPGGFWTVFAPYLDALNTYNSHYITVHGRRTIEFWLDGESPEARAAHWGENVLDYGFIVNNIWVVANYVARHYETLGNPLGALWAYRVAYAFIDPYQALIPHIGGDPGDMEFARIHIRNKINSLDVSPKLFAEVRDGSGRRAFFGSLHEPRAGIFFGEPVGGSVVLGAQQVPSGVTIYVEFETENLQERVEHDLHIFETRYGISRNDLSIVQIAWNFLHEGATPGTIHEHSGRILEAARYMQSTGLPILLRVGAEMNVWSVPADPGEFIAAFRNIASVMRREASNVAMVWSVNSVSAQGLDWEMFYPGDEFVDWVGISLYTTRYFLGDPHTTDIQAAIYRTGQYAYPIGFVRDLAAQFGDRKPIIISEGGVSLFNVRNSEDLTEWALPRIRQKYAYIPMLFPEVKAMFWFNIVVPHEAQRYDFAASPAARELYTKLTASEYFLGLRRTSSPITFREIGYATALPASSVTLLTYAPFFTFDRLVVEYSINGFLIGYSTDIPYRKTFDFSGEDDGHHTLTVTIYAEGAHLHTLTYSLVKQGGTVTLSARH